MAITVDRIEGEYAVLEIGDEMFDVPIEDLPEGIKEGDRLEIKVKEGDQAEFKILPGKEK